MNATTEQAAKPKASRQRRRRFKRRSIAAPLIAVAIITFASVARGGIDPFGALFFSGLLIISAVLSLILAGPRYVTVAMAAAPFALLAYALSNAGGPLRDTAPDIAVLLGATSAWTIGFIAARQRGTLDATWVGVIWVSLVYSSWVFFQFIGTSFSSTEVPTLTANLPSSIDAAILFGLLALIGTSRVLHVIKQMDAEALSRSEMVGRLLRDALGSFLLCGFAFTCLLLTGSSVGILFCSGIVIGYAWWDSLAIVVRDHRSQWVRILGRITPLVVIGLFACGIYDALYLDGHLPNTETAQTGSLQFQRLSVYLSAWLENPILGQGVGSIEAVGDRAMTLFNYTALSAPGDTQNLMLNWLVETGALGLCAAIIALVLAYTPIISALISHGTPRTFPRLAVMAGLFLLAHGIADSSLGIPSLLWLYALLIGAANGVAVARTARKPHTEV